MAVYCPRCNTANREGSRYCNNCGSQLQTPTGAVCPNCKAPIIAFSAFCHHCGARLPEPEVPVITPPEPITEMDEGEGSPPEEAEIISLDEVPSTPPAPGVIHSSAPTDTGEPQLPPAAESREPGPEAVQAAETVGSTPPSVTPPEVAAARPALVRVRPSIARSLPPATPSPPRATGDVWRRLAYLALALAIVAGLLLPGGLPGSGVYIPSEVRSLYQAIEELPPRSPVLVSFDYDTTTVAEMQPLAQAVLRHLIQRQARILTVSLSPQGPALAEAVLRPLADENIYAYGVDYVHLGYLSGGDAALATMAGGLTQAFVTDYLHGNPLSRLPVMRDISDATSIKLIVELAGDDGGVRRWIEQVQSRYGVRLVAATTALAQPLAFPYLQAGQMAGLVSGLPAATQYESLLGYEGQATRSMGALSLGQIAILLFVAIANLGLIVRRRPA